MAVEAHNLLPVREVADNAIESKQGYGNYYMGFVSPPYAPFCAPMPAAAAESDVTFANTVSAPQGAAPRKRARADERSLGVAAHAKLRRVLDVDPAVLRHVEEMSAELEQRRRYARQVVAAARAAVARRLVAKDEEVERVRRLNWALEERLRGMCADARAWRDLALSHEAAAAALRADLDHALRARAEAQARLADDDAGSCCYGDNGDCEAGGEEEAVEATSCGRCRGCGESAAVMLVLPCRHLCACAACAAVAWACPACGGAKSGAISVNLD